MIVFLSFFDITLSCAPRHYFKLAITSDDQTFNSPHSPLDARQKFVIFDDHDVVDFDVRTFRSLDYFVGVLVDTRRESFRT